MRAKGETAAKLFRPSDQITAPAVLNHMDEVAKRVSGCIWDSGLRLGSAYKGHSSKASR